MKLPIFASHRRRAIASSQLLLCLLIAVWALPFPALAQRFATIPGLDSFLQRPGTIFEIQVCEGTFRKATDGPGAVFTSEGREERYEHTMRSILSMARDFPGLELVGYVTRQGRVLYSDYKNKVSDADVRVLSGLNPAQPREWAIMEDVTGAGLFLHMQKPTDVFRIDLKFDGGSYTLWRNRQPPRGLLLQRESRIQGFRLQRVTLETGSIRVDASRPELIFTSKTGKKSRLGFGSGPTGEFLDSGLREIGLRLKDGTLILCESTQRETMESGGYTAEQAPTRVFETNGGELIDLPASAARNVYRVMVTVDEETIPWWGLAPTAATSAYSAKQAGRNP